MTKPLTILLSVIMTVAMDGMAWQPATSAATADDDTTECEKEDTLQTVVVKALSPNMLKESIDRSLKQNKMPRHTSLGDLLDKWLPGLQDRILHPFAIKARRKERRRRRLERILRDYERIKTPNEMLQEAIKRQMEEEEKE